MGTFQRPRSFDRNLIVIGGGSGGLVSVYLAALSGAKVTLIESGEMGGDCLNRGCVPSKAMIRSARAVEELRKATDLGVDVGVASVDFPRIMGRIRQVIKTIAPHDSIERYTALGVEVIQGHGMVSTPWSVKVNGQELTTRKMILATGARPHVPAIKGIEQIGYLTSDNLWELEQLPQCLLVIGAGTIGCELAQSFARLGSKVTLVSRADRILPNEDRETSELMLKQFQKEGMEVILRADPKRFSVDEGEQWVILSRLEEHGEERRVAFDQVLIATGRVPNLQGLGLEQLGIEIDPRSGVALNDQFQSRYPSVALCGDVAGSYQFTHAASNQAKSVTLNSLFGFFKRFKVDESVMPWATFTDPEVAQVGLNEQMARQQGISYEMTRFDFSDLDRAVIDAEASGWIKVLTKPGSDRLVGVTIVGKQAGELLQEYVLAMRQGLGLNAILGTIHPYPTRVEINQRVAGKWRQSNTPHWLLRLSRWLHGIQRRGLF